MKIYLDPIVDEQEDGSICTILFRATPSRIDERIKDLEGFRKAKFDIDKIVNVIRCASSSDEAEEQIRKKFKLTHSQARFMINATIDEMAIYCNPDRWQEEVEKWKALKKLVIE